jgi:hypothetical protein
MRRQRERVGFMRRALAVAGALGLLAGAASADVTTERSASILVFPKVIASGTRDTIIQITNTNNSMVHAHCIYVNAALTDPSEPPHPIFNPPQWNELDFDIWLTRQQPTVWIVTQGRPVNPTDNQTPCSPSNTACYGVGFDPGFVPPVPVGFEGELKCIEVDSSGFAMPGNHLKGEATLVDTTTGDVAKYNAVGILGNPDVPDEDGVLCLGGDVSESCPNGAEYNGCPNVWILNHFAEGALDPIAHAAGATANSVSTELTVVPCTEDLENKNPTTVVIQFIVTNEFETSFSASTSVTCWANERLGDINFGTAFNRTSLTTDFAQTRIRAVGDSGVIIVAEEFHSATITTARTASAAVNLHIEGERAGQDLITLQPDLPTPPEP